MSTALSLYLLETERTRGWVASGDKGFYRGDWLSTVDEGLRAVNVTAVSVADFQYGGLPAGLPYTDIPSCGEWSPEDCERALDQFEEGERLGIAPAPDREVAAAVAQVIGWLRRVPRGSGYGIIGFCS
ncbi:hypothetical protein [Streptomyces virginiae]|uniref:DUF7691 family protein n=1 Tax=Streptomyces virginiae TaxID=1961 RepID=UPI002DDB2E08|nr:hypothetical protein [Streptomyces virginiae]WSC74939.1 hypothetical protein OHA56_00550 [Streptomyces virginiae]